VSTKPDTPHASHLNVIGAVHGRFQPFHLEHLEYVRAAYARCDLLYVGITHADPTQACRDTSAPHRHLPEANPFPYWVRAEMVRESLTEAGCDLCRVRVVPFPISEPQLISQYVTPNARHFLSPCDPWQAKKLGMLVGLGYDAVFVLKPRKTIEGREVRRRLVRSLPIGHLVPAAVARLLERDDISKYIPREEAR